MGVSLAMAGAPCFGSVRHPGRAKAAYARAVEMQKRLEARPVRSRSVAQYKRVIREFRDVYLYDFACLKAPVAGEAMGDLYAEMGRVFSSARYYRDAVKAYKYVISQYPRSSMARDSALSIGKVYLDGLHDPDRAAEVFRALLKKHPSAPQAEVARKSLKEIADLRKQQEKPSSPSGDEAASNKESAGGSVEVTEVHDWTGPDYTRVVIGARGPFKFNTLRLNHPDRIVFDLPNTHLGHSLLGKVIPIDGDFLHDIRIGQFKPNVTRVVLDVKNIQDYSAFPLPNPFRLIIDVHGKSAGVVREASYQEASILPAAPDPTARPQPPAHAKAPVENHPAASKVSAEIEAGKRVRRNERRRTEAGSVDRKPPAAKRAAASSTRSKTKAAKRVRNSKHTKTEVASIQPKMDAIPIAVTPASPTSDGSETLTRALGLKVARIVIDPGHGGFDTGAIGPHGLREKDVALDIGLRLRKLLEERTDYKVFMTRSTDKFIPLEERTAIANADHADLFVSIHANASTDHRARGIATYFLNFTTDPDALKVAARENATSQESVHQLQTIIKKIALNNKIEESQQLARDIQTVLYRRCYRISHGIRNRRVHKAPFVVLIGANMPSVLVETGFITNPHTEHLMREPAYREQIAKGIFRGVQDYIENLGSVRVAQRNR
ncbi:MAG: N-acetylmuramoyl-L-alanine amidase [Acidobacteriota bacterium]